MWPRLRKKGNASLRYDNVKMEGITEDSKIVIEWEIHKITIENIYLHPILHDIQEDLTYFEWNIFSHILK